VSDPSFPLNSSPKILFKLLCTPDLTTLDFDPLLLAVVTLATDGRLSSPSPKYPTSGDSV
jgi:hypothetical protein